MVSQCPVTFPSYPEAMTWLLQIDIMIEPICRIVHENIFDHLATKKIKHQIHEFASVWAHMWTPTLIRSITCVFQLPCATLCSRSRDKTALWSYALNEFKRRVDILMQKFKLIKCRKLIQKYYLYSYFCSRRSTVIFCSMSINYLCVFALQENQIWRQQTSQA